jgi:FtsP/CotA-like multicopper oxidase with cupredoxin domain
MLKTDFSLVLGIILFGYIFLIFYQGQYTRAETSIAENFQAKQNSAKLTNKIISTVTTKNTNKDISISTQEYDREKNCTPDTSKRATSIEYLTYFNCGRYHENNGVILREFTLIIKENQPISIANNGLKFDAWTYNETIPGPTMRMTEGDQVKITVINSAENKLPHSLHMHSIHSSEMDGVDGPGGSILPGHSYTYKFVAQPYGVYPYHCHMSPVDQHINNGLYGMMIIDPKIPRPHMKEMAMLMNGYDLDYEKEGKGSGTIPTPEEAKSGKLPEEKDHTNEVYTVNGKAFDYMDNPITLESGKPYRIYLLNMLQFDLINTFHIHGTLFHYFPSGTSKTSDYTNDIVTMSEADRGVLEFKFDYPGRYMFHAHKAEFADLGWMGFFDVKNKASPISNFPTEQEKHNEHHS